MINNKKLVLISAASIVLFSLVAIFVLSGASKTFDTDLLLGINSQAQAFFDLFFPRITELGGVIVLFTASVLLIGFLVAKKAFLKAIFVAAGMLGGLALNLLLKEIFERPRPELWERLVTETAHSFPSGHATASMAFALIIVALAWQTKWRTLVIVIAALYVLVIGFSRLYLGVHYPTDIIGGWLLATAWISALVVLLRKVNSRKGRQS